MHIGSEPSEATKFVVASCPEPKLRPAHHTDSSSHVNSVHNTCTNHQSDYRTNLSPNCSCVKVLAHYLCATATHDSRA